MKLLTCKENINETNGIQQEQWHEFNKFMNLINSWIHKFNYDEQWHENNTVNLQIFGIFVLIFINNCYGIAWEQCLKISGLYNENWARGTHLKFMLHQHTDDSSLLETE